MNIFVIYISFSDADRNLWLTDISDSTTTKIDNEGFAHPERTIFPAWSPDSKWIAYTKRLTNQYNAIFVYSLEQKKSFQITDGMADSKSPAWDASGKYLYFLASTDYGLNVGWLDLSSLERPIRRAVYVAILPVDEPSPLLPQNDDETNSDKTDNKKKGSNKRDNQSITQSRLVVIQSCRDYD